MKKILIIITGVWLMILTMIVYFNLDYSKKSDTAYKISINRIHNQLSADLKQNQQIIKHLSEEDLLGIKSVDIIDSVDTVDSIDKSDVNLDLEGRRSRFFQIDNAYEDFVVFMPIENTSLIVRFDLKAETDNNRRQVIGLSIIVTLVYLFMSVSLFLAYKNIIKPMERLSKVTRQMATGYIGKMNLQYKNAYVKDFIWGLDMLREQLSYEKDKNAELEKQRKTLVAGLSHDIKTPLSCIKNYAIALKEGVYEKDMDKEHALNIILEKAEVIERLTKELLETSSQAIGEIVVELKEVYLLNVNQQLNSIIHQKIDLLHMKYEDPRIDENVLVLVDLERLSEVFDNVIENALKYGDRGSLSVAYETEEDYKLITISNTGSQVPEKEIKHIFTSYYRGSNVGNKPGHGLGLYISKQIMKKMNGDIFARNTGEGVSFVIVIKQR